MTQEIESNVTQRDRYRTLCNQLSPGRRMARGEICGFPSACWRGSLMLANPEPTGSRIRLGVPHPLQVIDQAAGKPSDAMAHSHYRIAGMLEVEAAPGED